MKYVKVMLLMMAITLSITGCSKIENEESEAPLVTEETTVEAEAPKPDKTEPEIVEETTLSQAEIDELKANAPTDTARENAEIYEAIINKGKWTSDSDTIYTTAVGKPDSSWRRMTDEEAKAISAKGEDSWEAAAAQAELEGNSWYWLEPTTNTIYFDYYVYQEKVAKPRHEQRMQEELEYNQQQLEEILSNPDVYLEASETCGKIYLDKWAVESLEIWETYPEELKAIIELY